MFFVLCLRLCEDCCCTIRTWWCLLELNRFWCMDWVWLCCTRLLCGEVIQKKGQVCRTIDKKMSVFNFNNRFWRINKGNGINKKEAWSARKRFWRQAVLKKMTSLEVSCSYAWVVWSLLLGLAVSNCNQILHF